MLFIECRISKNTFYYLFDIDIKISTIRHSKTMPKNYSNSKLYKMEAICESEEGDIYIGSTTQNYISHRLAEHVRGYNNWKKNGNYDFISSYILFDKYGIDNVRIVLLESYPCHNNDELRAREAHYQKTLKCVNQVVAFRSKKERLEQMKQYQEEHQEELSEYHKKYRIENYKEILEKNKKYYIENRNKILEQQKPYQKKYYQENKNELLELITCECGRQSTKKHLKRHQCSDIHKDLMLQLTNEK